MIVRLLSKDEFLATFAVPMRDVTETATSVVDIWPYIASVPQEHLSGHQVYDQFVEYVYRSGNGNYDHVLVMTRTKNVYLVIVVDLQVPRIHGHHLLNLNKEYGLS